MPVTRTALGSLPVGGAVAQSAGLPASAGRTAGEDAAVGAAYQSFLSAVSGLDATFQRTWITALANVATPAIVASVTSAANTIHSAHEHTVGRLTDANVRITVTGLSATLSDCLDEYDWYPVEDGTTVPDPAVSRGHFACVASLTDTGGRWYVAGFHPATTAC